MSCTKVHCHERALYFNSTFTSFAVGRRVLLCFHPGLASLCQSEVTALITFFFLKKMGVRPIQGAVCVCVCVLDMLSIMRYFLFCLHPLILFVNFYYNTYCLISPHSF